MWWLWILLGAMVVIHVSAAIWSFVDAWQQAAAFGSSSGPTS
jgi:hypothetical protein